MFIINNPRIFYKEYYRLLAISHIPFSLIIYERRNCILLENLFLEWFYIRKTNIFEWRNWSLFWLVEAFNCTLKYAHNYQVNKKLKFWFVSLNKLFGELTFWSTMLWNTQKYNACWSIIYFLYFWNLGFQNYSYEYKIKSQWSNLKLDI